MRLLLTYSILLVAFSISYAQKRPFSFRYNDFQQEEGLYFKGDAHAEGGTAHLVEAENFQSGAMWYGQSQVPIGEQFSTTFAFRLSQPCECKGGADGLALVIHTNPQVGQLGKNAQGLGYEGIPNSIALEFDAFNNREGSDHHVSLHTRKSQPNSADPEAAIAYNHGLPSLKNGKTYKVLVNYKRGRMKVFFDEMISPVLDVYVDLEKMLQAKDGKAWIGFTASTGGGKALHELSYWSFEAKGDKKARKTPKPAPRPVKDVVVNIPQPKVPVAEVKPAPRPRSRPKPEPQLAEDKIITNIEDRNVKAPTKIIRVSSPNLTISLWDNNRKDGDIVSINLNGEWVVNSVKLKKKKQDFFVRLSEENNQLILHAHNLGKYPPNTASMAINDGKRRRVLTLESNLQTSESVTIQYAPNP